MTRSLPILAAAFAAAFLALMATPPVRSRFRGLVGSLYRGWRVEGVRDEGWREPYDDDEGLFV